MTLEQTKKLAQHIFRLLKVNEIVLPIGRTNKGDLGIKFTQNRDDYEIVLDAVPLKTDSIINDDNNIELKKMIEKYLFDKDQDWGKLAEIVDDGTTTVSVNKIFKSDYSGNIGEDVTEKMLGKKRGRPQGSKNKPKE